MDHEVKTENPSSQGSLISSHRQRFPLSSLEIVFGSLIVLGLIYIGYIIFFQEGSSGSISSLEKKIKNLETLTREQGEKLDKKIKEIQENQARLEARLKVLETVNQEKTANVAAVQSPKAVEKIPPQSSPEKKRIQHKVKKGETLQKIAAKYKVSPGDLLQWNKRSKNKPVRPGEILIIVSR